MSLIATLTDYNSTKSLGHWFRKRRSHHLLSLLSDCYNTFGQVDVIDIGGRPSYWNIFPQSVLVDFNVSILFVNRQSELPEHENNPRFSQLQADGCDLSMFQNQEFHLAHSNSVVEHVGDWERVKMFAAETKRVGQAYYVQTPNFSFPIEPHYVTPFFHWLPEQTRAQILQKIQLGPYPKETDIIKTMETVQSINLLNTTMMTALFPDARLEKERILGMAKSLIAIRDINVHSSHVHNTLKNAA